MSSDPFLIAVGIIGTRELTDELLNEVIAEGNAEQQQHGGRRPGRRRDHAGRSASVPTAREVHLIRECSRRAHAGRSASVPVLRRPSASSCSSRTSPWARPLPKPARQA